MEKEITPSQWSDKTMIINTKVLEDIFIRENKFITKKVVMGISAKK